MFVKRDSLILHLYYKYVYTLEKKIMPTLPSNTATEMEVTSIRLEKSLKQKLRQLSGNQGYQALIRDILWNYVNQKSGDYRPAFRKSDIRATLNATARKDETCALTGKRIQENEQMLLALTIQGNLVPLSLDIS
jgi:predicted DNA-binding protein